MGKAHKYALTGDEGGISRGASGKTSTIAFYVVQPHRLEVLKAASNAFIAEEQAPGDRGPVRVLRGFKIACTRIESRRAGLWQQTGVESPAYPSLYQDSIQ